MYINEQAPNIVLIVLDTHRLDRIGCYGYDRGTTPNLDAFACDAVLFEHAVAPAQWTIPSHASTFSGEPPTTHMTIQSGDALDPRFKTLADRLRERGYRTTAFCNNPLVGVLKNGFKRGFDVFYNYSGAIPSVPARQARRVVSPLFKLWERYTQLMRRVSYPVQNLFASSTRIFMAALNPLWVPIWTRLARWKGNTPRSLHDAGRFIREEMDGREAHFVFINLMQTHLPFRPPERFVRHFAPQVIDDHTARDFMRTFNRRAADWITPLEQPFSEIEARTLSDMYDAEVAYQDDLCAELFETLDRPARRADTAVIIVSDHGEMLGEHGRMGHAFGVCQELIHVPLLIRLAGQKAGRRIDGPVSTTRLFHTMLDLAEVETYATHYSPAVDVRSQSLICEMRDPSRPQAAVISEAYAPDFALSSMLRHKPGLIERLNSRATNRAIYEDRFKLVQVEGDGEQLYDLDADRREQHPLALDDQVERLKRLLAAAEAFVDKAESRRLEGKRQRAANHDDELVQQRLRGLGYID